MKRHTKALVRMLREQLDEPVKGAEIGVWEGENSENLLRAFPRLYLFMVDKYLTLDEHEREHHKRMANFTQAKFNEAWRFALDRTKFANGRRMLYVMESREAAKRILRFDLDFVFIDGSHDYDSVRTDLEYWAPKVRVGGIVSGHDYDGRGDRSGKFGVKKAVDERFGEVNVHKAGGLVWWTRKEPEA